MSFNSKTKSNKKSSDELSSTIHHTYGYLNTGESKVVAEVSWGSDSEPQFEIRRCKKDDEGNIVLLKGIRLTDDEVDKLAKYIEDHKARRKKQKGVEFSEIFKESSSIIDKRSQGLTTDDGCFRMQYAPGARINRK